MAAIGSIRKRSGLLIAIIGVALVLFLLSDFLGKSNIGQPDIETNVGYIGNEAISNEEFAYKLEQAYQAQAQGGSLSESQRTSVRNRVWEQVLREKILDKEYAKLGIHVTPDELLHHIQNARPGSVLYQVFSDPNTGQIADQFRDPRTGMLDGQKVLQVAQSNLQSEDPSQWIAVEQAVKEDAKMQKYLGLLKSGISATSIEAEEQFKNQNAMVSFNYVVKEFMSIADEEIEVTDDDLKAYYNAHKDEKQYQQEVEMRNIKYVVFEMTPSAEDIEDIKLDLADLIPAFAADSNDTAFVAENSDRRTANNLGYKAAETLNPAIKDSLIAGEVGEVFGPYTDGDYMVISKLSKIEMAPDSVNARHILIKADLADTAAIAAAKAKLDSLKDVAKRKRNFADLAKEFSEDLGSGANGGDLNWFGRGMMVPPFEKACFEGEVGDMPIVESQFGVHLIEIMEQTEEKPRYLVSSVDRKIEPSKATSDAAYTAASMFSVNNNTQAKFEEAAASEVLLVGQNLTQSTKSIGRIQDAGEIVRWAFNNEVGTISEPFETETSAIVAMVDVIKDKGTISFEAAKEMVRPRVIQEKKAEK